MQCGMKPIELTVQAAAAKEANGRSGGWCCGCVHIEDVVDGAARTVAASVARLAEQELRAFVGPSIC